MNQYIENTCKIGQGAECCKYLALSGGWLCMKASPINKATIDNAWKTTPHVAQGDNCEGKSDLDSLEGYHRTEDPHISEDGHYPGLPFHP